MRRHFVFIAILVVLLVGTTSLLSAQQMTITEDNLLRLIKSNAPPVLVIKVVQTAKAVEVDTSPDGIVALLNKGVSQEVLSALVDRKAQLSSSTLTPSVRVSAPTAVPSGTDNMSSSQNGCPQQDGVYYMSESGWVPMEKAPQMEMSNNFSKVGNPFSSKTMGFKLDGPEAPVKVSLKPEFCVVGGGVSTREIIIVPLAKRGRDRELVERSYNMLGRAKTVGSDKLDLKIEKSDKQVVVQLAEVIKPGEYALKMGFSVFDFSAR